MPTKVLYHLSFFLMSLLSGMLLVLSFPPYNMGWLAWIGLIPLLIAVSGKSLTESFLLAYAGSIVFYPGIFSWILDISGYTLIHHLMLGIWLGSFFGLFGLAFGLISKRFGLIPALIISPFIWVCMEFLRSNITFLSLPWGLLGHSQHQYPVVIQIAGYTGTYGISFLIVLVNAAITANILSVFKRSAFIGLSVVKSPTAKGVISISVVAAVLTGTSILYGKKSLAEPIPGERIKACVVQGNIAQSKKWDPEYKNFIMQTYLDLSKKSSEDRPDLIIWPEAATPGNIIKDASRWKQMKSLIDQTKTHYLIGSAEYPKFQKVDRGTDKKYGNTALFISPQGKLMGQYLKIRLIPFSEYIPYEGHIKWPRFIVPEDKHTYLLAGREYTLFDLDGTLFGVPICWENIFPQIVRGFCKKGAQFIVNITNEAWFGESAAPWQFLSMSIFRAVENRVTIVRAGNTGISCFIDPYGRITGMVRKGDKELFVRGHMTRTIRAANKKTFYTIYGDVFAYVCLFVTAVAVISCFRRSQK